MANKNSGYLTLERIDENTYELVINSKDKSPVKKLKITDFNISEWIDDWREDPKIEKLNLSNNLLERVYIFGQRDYLREVNLSKNLALKDLVIESAPHLQKLIINHCFALENIDLLNTPSLSYVDAVNCKLSSPQVDQIINSLSLYTIWNSYGMIDLRGNSLPQASEKLSILLSSDNWEVKLLDE